MAAAHAAESDHTAESDYAAESDHAAESDYAAQAHHAPLAHHAPIVSCFLASSGILTSHWTADNLVQSLFACSGFDGTIGDVRSRDLGLSRSPLEAFRIDFQREEPLPLVLLSPQGRGFEQPFRTCMH